MDEIIEIFKQHANPSNAMAMKAYMKNRFEFFGIKTELRRDISKPLIQGLKSLSKSETVELCKSLWKEPQRELHYFAQELLLQNTKRKFEKSDIKWIKWFIERQQWWDTIDLLAPKILGEYLKKFPEQRNLMLKEWCIDKDIWKVRSSLLFQLKYKDKTDFPLLFEIILKSCHTKEFFINKAIGWMMRENSRTYPALITDFISQNESRLHPLSKREGLRLM